MTESNGELTWVWRHNSLMQLCKRLHQIQDLPRTQSQFKSCLSRKLSETLSQKQKQTYKGWGYNLLVKHLLSMYLVLGSMARIGKRKI